MVQFLGAGSPSQPYNPGMLLTITTTHDPAADLGYLLHKNPANLHSFDWRHASKRPTHESPRILFHSEMRCSAVRQARA